MKIHIIIESGEGELIYEKRTPSVEQAIFELKRFDMHGRLCEHCGGKLTAEDGRFCSPMCTRLHETDVMEMEATGN